MTGYSYDFPIPVNTVRKVRFIYLYYCLKVNYTKIPTLHENKSTNFLSDNQVISEVNIEKMRILQTRLRQ